ncbi:MAG: 4-hydroxy-tetrahydrodipicolinate synthase [Desulfarculaceae bacterium]|nr:4-hydroxy-tetrahydrodipicolinate synthase [Desulfarculaceae bacterium]MCF8048195.1 4-hydroxy-tetrahydrodipicolinate synthase [Desulfarculaceae bacterium]MCF8065145.1 4-hydroxy-tetrahydrodipicolinate synthase [Desulfarculaceae bacterium]MCF8096803.1 4-hydroxy-tetrahydrodipicolinate synthase [Desulfarculaceae bacterium]MCF8122619.1 4-hydroxy-tetrahydrodipicolinate synthase [Desulfarculaceae bacterium]
MLKGAMVALVTPFTADGQVDEESLRRLIEWHIESGTDGIVPCGTTGESPTLSHDEHRRVVEITVEQVNKRVPVVAGAGSNSTAEAIALTQHAKQVGADAALLVTPYYNKPTQEGVYRHFAAVAKEASFPLVPYNIAGRTGTNIEPATMARLAELPEVIACKEASGNISQMAEIYYLCGDKMDLLSGDDNMILPLLSIGGKGIISVVNNIIPSEMSQLCRLWFDGDLDGARDIYYKILPLCKAMFIETNPIPVKVAMGVLGRIPNASLRLPLCEMAPANLERLKKALADYGLK